MRGLRPLGRRSAFGAAVARLFGVDPRHRCRQAGLRMTAIAAELGLSVSRVSRVIAREEIAVQASQAKGKT